MIIKRRAFLKQSQQIGLGLGLLSVPVLFSACNEVKEGMDKSEEATKEVVKTAASPFKISLAQWSLNKALFAKEIDNLDFASVTKNTYGLDGIEYVNQFFPDKAEDTSYLKEMNKRAADNGVNQLLIMIDREGDLGNLNDKERIKAVEKHYKWVTAAKELGCHSIRVNAFGEGSAEDVKKAAIDGLGRLSEFGANHSINVIVENHGSWSSNGQWLSDVMEKVNMPNCGTLPDFGNFCIKRESGKAWDGNCIEEYDKYKGVKEMLPYAKALSAKSFRFNAEGEEPDIDFGRMIKLAREANYKGYIGIEYEGDELSAEEGIKATIALLKKYI